MLQETGHPLFGFYRFALLAGREEILHFVSSGEYSIGFSDLLLESSVAAHRRQLAQAVGFDAERMVTGHQVHGTHVAVVSASDAGRGALSAASRIPDTDALVTDCRGVCLTVLSADCVPILLYDPVRRVVAAAHAGWRGTAANIVGEVVGVMVQRFGCCPADILAGIGPSIGPCCFEVDADVARIFGSHYPDMVCAGEREGKYRVDLWGVNRQELLDAGLLAGHIEVAGVCTVCSPDGFFSYRREGEMAGRFGAGICLRAE